MPNYRIHRMKEAPRQQFRWAPHVSGCAGARPKDYEQSGEIRAANEYEAWQLLKETEQPLGVGDLLENEKGELRIYKYVGFDTAQWVIPEPKPHVETETAPAAEPAHIGN